MFSPTILSQIKALFNKVGKNDEFEIMFNNYKPDNKLSIVKFMDVLKYLKWKSDNDKLELVNDTSLDVAYAVDQKQVYRITISGNKLVNDILNLVHQRKNHIIYSILISQFRKDPNFTFMMKTKDSKNVIDIDTYDIRVRKSGEEEITEKQFKDLENLPITEIDKIFFRYKQRLSLKLINSKDEKASIDLTIVKATQNPNELQTVNKIYELEIDYMSSKPSEKSLQMLMKETELLKQVLEGSNILMTKEESKKIEDIYKKMTYGIVSDQYTKLYSMQPVAAEVQHIVDKIPNKYSVTDKADGDKYQLFIHNEDIYMISNNMNIKKINKKVKGLDNTIIEGELIHLVNENKYLFMGFDCLFYNDKDIRNEVNQKERIKKVEDVMSKLQSNTYNIKEYSEKFDLEKQEKYYNNEMINFYSNLNKLIKSSKSGDYIFHTKMFLFPKGGSNSEVFTFAHLIWQGCTSSDKINCPYYLDGIIFTGLEQKYTRDKKDHKYPTYKYKPPEKNSIDIYVQFQKNPETGGYLEIFDNSLPIKMADNEGGEQVFRVVNFMVGDVIGDKEVPVQFMREENNHEAFFPLKQGEIRDVEGNLIQDNTVIEVIYSNNPNIPHQYRWSILKTRWDKTESVLREQKQYGNFKDVAIKTWYSMKEAVTIEEIKKLSNPETYIAQQKILQSRINTVIISTDKAQDKFYQMIKNLCNKMKRYHDWVKSSIIYTYCQSQYKNKSEKPNRSYVLEIGCGNGVDIMKFYHAKAQEYVGIDIDYEGLFSATDSAVSRYNTFKAQFPNYGKYTFILADGRLPLKSDVQSKKLTNMTQENKTNIDKIFNSSRKFDVITSMFGFQYLFDTQASVNNIIDIINNNLNVGGFIILSLFDPNEVMKLLGDKDVFTSYYTDDDGQKQKLIEIQKKFTGGLKDEPGQAIDVMLRWVLDNTQKTEYLVTPKLLLKTLDKAGCELLDTDLFSNVFTTNKPWFNDVIQHEENPKNKKFYQNTAEFFGELKGADKESKTYSFLNRYYVFQKIK